jgi:trimethylamine--corrinoid protein Co-methyltransferase
LALAIAELLSGLVLSQLIQPGAPIRLFGLNGTSDMKSGEFTFAAPEAALMAGGLAQMFRFYRVPHGIHGGSQSRSNTLDAQVGYEVGIQNLFAALTGTDLVAEAVSGTLENSNTSHPEQAIIGNEICNYINRILKGIEVTRETLAVDIMREVGVGGQFLSHKHTRQHFREEHYESKLANRMKMQAWEDAGARDIQMRANEEWDRIIANHKPTPLAPDVFKSIQDIVDRASV